MSLHVHDELMLSVTALSLVAKAHYQAKLADMNQAAHEIEAKTEDLVPQEKT